MTGSSGGWQQASFYLSAFAGEQVEVSISYVTDPFTGGSGRSSTTPGWSSAGPPRRPIFETALVGAGPPPGSPPGGGDFKRALALLSPAITTADTVLFGFGIEQIGSAAERTNVLGGVVDVLLGGIAT